MLHSPLVCVSVVHRMPRQTRLSSMSRLELRFRRGSVRRGCETRVGKRSSTEAARELVVARQRITASNNVIMRMTDRVNKSVLSKVLFTHVAAVALCYLICASEADLVSAPAALITRLSECRTTYASAFDVASGRSCLMHPLCCCLRPQGGLARMYTHHYHCCLSVLQLSSHKIGIDVACGRSSAVLPAPEADPVRLSYSSLAAYGRSGSALSYYGGSELLWWAAPSVTFITAVHVYEPH